VGGGVGGVIETFLKVRADCEDLHPFVQSLVIVGRGRKSDLCDDLLTGGGVGKAPHVILPVAEQ
jgi:hypothetical protein